MTAALSAAAQDVAPAPSDRQPVRRADLSNDCARRDGLAFCGEKFSWARRRARGAARARSGGAWTRLTRVAGMFMGRVDAVELGGLKLRVNLELR